MADKKVKDLDNFENYTENILANMSNMGYFSQAFSSVTPLTQVNPFAMVPKNRDNEEVDSNGQ